MAITNEIESGRATERPNKPESGSQTWRQANVSASPLRLCDLVVAPPSLVNSVFPLYRAVGKLIETTRPAETRPLDFEVQLTVSTMNSLWADY